MTYEGFDLIDLEKVLVDGRVTLDTTPPNPVTSKYFAGTGNYNLTGKGQTVCLIDSGLYANNPEFQGKVLVSEDLTGFGAPGDEWNHGTKMAGIIAAKGVKMQGLAYNANIVNLRVTDASGGGWSSYLGTALDWCFNNASTYNITSVYIGVGTGLADGTEGAGTSGSTATKINNLISNNITVVAPAGHDNNWTHIAYPSCIANTISVGAIADGSDGAYPEDTWNLTAVGVQSNRRDGLLDILASGDIYTKTTDADPSKNYTGSAGVGTSVATAYVAGASMLLREYWDARNWDYSPNGLINGNIPNTIEYIFNKTGKLIEDDLNPGVYYPRLDLYAAINYEEYPPVVNLETPLDAATENEGVITFEYNTADTQHNIKNCSLYIDGSLDQTDTSVTESVTQSFIKSLTPASYNWEVKCYDNSTIPNEGVSGTRSLTVNPFVPMPNGDEESFPLINVPAAREYAASQGISLTGAGQTVCIIDTGVSYNHDDLGNCSGTTFLTGNCHKTLTGYDLCGDSANCAGSPDIDPGDENGHGTGVAGIIAGNGSGYKGIAPDATIVAVKITDANGLGWGSLLNNAVRWCTDNATKYNITMIRRHNRNIISSLQRIYNLNFSCCRWFRNNSCRCNSKQHI
jgi:subtilisin family serine protease